MNTKKNFKADANKQNDSCFFRHQLQRPHTPFLQRSWILHRTRMLEMRDDLLDQVHEHGIIMLDRLIQSMQRRLKNAQFIICFIPIVSHQI